MPKIVDHDARRAELAAAVWRLASRDGLDAVTVRRVAAEAGWSTGALAHYFDDKEELLVFAFETVADRVGRRIVKAAEHARDPLELVRTQLVEGLAIDTERRAEVRVWFAFLWLAETRPRLQSPHSSSSWPRRRSSSTVVRGKRPSSATWPGRAARG